MASLLLKLYKCGPSVLQVLRILLEAGADPDMRDMNG